MLSEEEKKAIERLNEILKEWQEIVNIEDKTEREIEMSLYMEEMPFEEIKTVLNLITKLQKENEILKRAFDKQTADMSNNLLELQQKDKQIDLMAEVMFKNNTAQLIIEYGIGNKEQIIKEFEKLVKEEGE